MHVSGRDESFASATLDSNATTSCRASYDAHGLVLLFGHLHVVDLFAELYKDLLQLLVLVSLLLVLLLEERLALNALLILPVRNLQIDLQDRALIDCSLIKG